MLARTKLGIQELVSSTLQPFRCRVMNDLGQVVHTHLPLTPSSIILVPAAGSDVLRLGR